MYVHKRRWKLDSFQPPCGDQSAGAVSTRFLPPGLRAPGGLKQSGVRPRGRSTTSTHASRQTGTRHTHSTEPACSVFTGRRLGLRDAEQLSQAQSAAQARTESQARGRQSSSTQDLKGAEAAGSAVLRNTTPGALRGRQGGLACFRVAQGLRGRRAPGT